jgi:hypothetical protein
MGRIIVGVIGPGAGATVEASATAFELGKLIAGEGWVLLTGGRSAGVMEASSRGARAGGGLIVGILPSADTAGASEFVDIAIVTGMGQARNNINVLSSQLLFACGTGTGTTSEIALAFKAHKRVILLCMDEASEQFFRSLGQSDAFTANTPHAAIELAKRLLAEK